jgi:hypothetical protein
MIEAVGPLLGTRIPKLANSPSLQCSFPVLFAPECVQMRKQLLSVFFNLYLLRSLLEPVSAGPIADRLRTDIDGVREMIESGEYAPLLQFVRDAYAESKQPNGEPAEMGYALAFSQTTTANRLALALDFALGENDFVIKQFGARAIIEAVHQNEAIPINQRGQLIAKLKTELGALANAPKEAVEFANQAATALILLGDDAGLNVWLTDKQEVGNYQKRDQWAPTSSEGVFSNLKQVYQARAAESTNANPEVDKVTAAVYELCRQRRVENKQIVPIDPFVDLHHLRTK